MQQSPSVSDAGLVWSVCGVVVDGRPCLPGDPQYQGGDGKSDDRVSSRDAQGDTYRRDDHSKRDVSIDAGMVSVGDERGTVESLPGPEPHSRRQLIADEPNESCRREGNEVPQRLRVDQSQHGFVRRDARTHKDRHHDHVPRPPFAPFASEYERDPERDGSEGVTAVVDQISQQRDRTRQCEHHRLKTGSHSEHTEADRNRPHSFARTHDRPVDPPVSVTMFMFMVVLVLATRFARPERKHRVAVNAVMVVLMGPEPMLMRE